MRVLEDPPHLVGRGVARGVGERDLHVRVERHHALDPVERVRLRHHALEGAVEHAGQVEAELRALRRPAHDGGQLGEALSRVRLRLALLWLSVTDMNRPSRSAPAFIARSKPRRFGTSTVHSSPSSCLAAFSTSPVSAICGTARGDTKLPTSMRRMPAS
jgi:hypothetical protein